MAADILAVLDALGIAQADIMGYSMGGFLAIRLMQRCAAARPPRRSLPASARNISATSRDRAEIIAQGLLAPDPATIVDPEAIAFRTFCERAGNDLVALAACIRRPRRIFEPPELGADAASGARRLRRAGRHVRSARAAGARVSQWPRRDRAAPQSSLDRGRSRLQGRGARVSQTRLGYADGRHAIRLGRSASAWSRFSPTRNAWCAIGAALLRRAARAARARRFPPRALRPLGCPRHGRARLLRRHLARRRGRRRSLARRLRVDRARARARRFRLPLAPQRAELARDASDPRLRHAGAAPQISAQARDGRVARLLRPDRAGPRLRSGLDEDARRGRAGRLPPHRRARPGSATRPSADIAVVWAKDRRRRDPRLHRRARA